MRTPIAAALALALLGCGPTGPLRLRAWLGDASAQFSLGRLLEEGAPGLARDPEAAGGGSRGAAAGGQGAYALNAARLFRAGIGVPADAAQTERWLRRAADAGSARGEQLLAAFLLQRAQRPEEGQEVEAIARRAAQAGNAGAMLLLARLYARGAPGVGRDDAESASWLRAAAEEGLVEAQRELSERLLRGEGMARDPLAAERWLRAVREREPGYSQAGLRSLDEGYRRLTGQGADEDPEAAAAWYGAAARGGDAVAQWVFGSLLVAGRGVPADPPAGFAWIERAARAGHAPARLALARGYYRGELLPRDLVLAQAWFRASGPSLEAQGMLERIASLLDASERERAESLALGGEADPPRAQEPPRW